MSTLATSPSDSNDILRQVAELVRQTLALPDTEPVKPEQLLFYDLGFTSMDLLDLLFRIEQHFEIRVPEGTIYQLARGETPESDFAHEGVLSEQGRRKLMKLLHDSPSEIFPDRIHASTLPRYCTVAAFVRLVEHKMVGDQ